MFILKNIKDGIFRCFDEHENKTVLDRSKLVCTKDDLTKLKHILNKTDFIESCGREKMNTKWRVNKLTNLTLFALLLKDVPMGCKAQSCPNHFWKTPQPTVLVLKRTQDNHITTTSVCFMLLLSVCTENINWRKKHRNFLNLFLSGLDRLSPQSVLRIPNERHSYI